MVRAMDRGRADAFDNLPETSRALVRQAPRPRWVEPMLATLSEPPAPRGGWIFERKLDGVRCLIFKGSGRVEIYSRNRKPLDEAYPELHEAFMHQPGAEFVADGEIVAFRGKATSFEELQGRLGPRDSMRIRATRIPVFIYLFDLLYADGYDLRRVPLIDRKAMLERYIRFEDSIRYTDHRAGGGGDQLRQACRKGWEGLIAKRADSPYQPGRSRDWLKLKCSARQEFVIVGFTDPKGSRVGLGSLLLGYYDRGLLRYAGKVGTGFDYDLLATLRHRLEKGEQAEHPLDEEPPRMREAHWVRPALVAEIAFTEWTSDGRLRHPRFVGLRNDKPPQSIVREHPSR